MKILALITSTFRELILKATLIILASISTLMLLGTLLVVSTQETGNGTQLLIFGQPAGPPAPQEQMESILEPLQATLAGGLMTGIVLLGIFATGGVLPDVLEKGIVDVYLSKPIHRWELVAGKSLGAVAVIGVNILYFIGGLWLIFGLKLGIWNQALLLSTLTITFVFVIIYSLVAFSGVLSRNMPVTLILVFLYLFVVGELLEGRELGLYRISENPVYRGVLDGLYYLLPQISALRNAVVSLIAHRAVEWASFVQCLLSATLLYAGSAFVLQRKDL